MVFIYNYIQFFGLLPIFSEVAKCKKKNLEKSSFCLSRQSKWSENIGDKRLISATELSSTSIASPQSFRRNQKSCCIFQRKNTVFDRKFYNTVFQSMSYL